VAVAVRPSARAVTIARPTESALTSAVDDPWAVIAATAVLLMLHSTWAGVLPERVATLITRASPPAIVTDVGNSVSSSDDFVCALEMSAPRHTVSAITAVRKGSLEVSA
jgi:hypothetical protein